MKKKLSKKSISHIFSLFRSQVIIRVIDWLGFWGMLKYIEIKLFGRYASTYCYPLPDTVYFQVTNHCQIHCKYCYRKHADLMSTDQGMMSFDNFVRIVRQLKGVRKLKLQWGGEPLLHRDIVRMLHYIKDNNISRWFGVLTNGMLLTPDVTDRILATNLDSVGISFDSPVAEIQESLRGGSKLSTIFDNIRYVARNAGNKTQVEIWSVLTTENLESLKTMPELLNDLGVRYFRTQTIIVRTSETRNLRPSETDELVNLLHKKCRKLGIRYRHYKMHPKTTCIDPFVEIGVTWDGKISPCVYILTMGLNKKPFSFTGFWNGPEMRAWRRKILQGNYPEICKRNCDIVGEVQTLEL